MRPLTNQPIRLWLPPVPSVNELFRTAGYGRDVKTSGRIKTQAYEMWRTAASMEVMRQRIKRIDGMVTLDFFHGERSMLADCSNYVKAPEDLLVELGIINGDNAKTVRRISSGWVPNFTGTVVHVTPLAETAHGGARWWVGFDKGVLGNEEATVPSGRRQGQASGTGSSQATMSRRRGRPPKS